MRSWAEWFVHRADERKRASGRPCGFRERSWEDQSVSRAPGPLESLANVVLNKFM